MGIVNRVALIVRPKRKYVEWANGVASERPTLSLEEARGLGAVYLVDAREIPPDLSGIIDAYGVEVFEHELAAWDADEDCWPKNRTPHSFRDWFDVQVIENVYDCDETPLIGQSEEEGFVCAWCENAIEDEESVTTVSLSLQNRQLVEEYAGGPMPFPVPSEGRIVTAYVSGAESEAQGEGSDVFFALCSGECAKALRDALKRSEGMVQS